MDGIASVGTESVAVLPASGGGSPPPTFNPAWARNSNTVIVAANAGSDQK